MAELMVQFCDVIRSANQRLTHKHGVIINYLANSNLMDSPSNDLAGILMPARTLPRGSQQLNDKEQ